MSRNIVALAVLAVSGVALIVPDPSFARGGGVRGGFHGLRAPAIITRHPHANILRHGLRPPTFQFRHPVIPRLPHSLARTTVRAPFVRLARRHHRAFVSSWIYPTTTDDDSAYIGMPYDPGTAIPVYGPAPASDMTDPSFIRSFSLAPPALRCLIISAGYSGSTFTPVPTALPPIPRSRR